MPFYPAVEIFAKFPFYSISLDGDPNDTGLYDGSYLGPESVFVSGDRFACGC